MNIDYGSTSLGMTLTPNNNGIYYIAMPACDNKTFQVSVSDGTKSYVIEVPSTTFAVGLFYCCNVSFTYNEINEFEGDTGYTVNDGYHNMCRGTNITSSQLVLKGGSKATLGGLGLQSPEDKYGIDCEGNATIILKDGTTNTITGATVQALGVKDGMTLTIEGTGTLTLQGYDSKKAVDGTVSIEGNTPITGDKDDGTYEYTNLKLVVSDNGNKWVISKKN